MRVLLHLSCYIHDGHLPSIYRYNLPLYRRREPLEGDVIAGDVVPGVPGIPGCRRCRELLEGNVVAGDIIPAVPRHRGCEGLQSGHSRVSSLQVLNVTRS
jgi:hypothetical protein